MEDLKNTNLIKLEALDNSIFFVDVKYEKMIIVSEPREYTVFGGKTIWGERFKGRYVKIIYSVNNNDVLNEGIFREEDYIKLEKELKKC